MKIHRFYQLALAIALSFCFTPVFSQTWEELMNQAIKYRQQNDVFKTNQYAEKAFQKAKASFDASDSRYQQTLNLYATSTIWVLENKGDLGKPNYTAAVREFSSLYLQSGNKAKADSLIALSRKSELDYFKKGNLNWEELDSRLFEYYNQGDFEMAIGYAEIAVKKVEVENGKDHLNYARSLNYLAMIYIASGNYAFAVPLFQQALNITKKALGTDDPGYATLLNYLAMAYQNLSNYAAAEPLFNQSLEIRKKELGTDHPDYAQSLNDLANLYRVTGNYALAEPLYQQALEIRKKALGLENPYYAQSLSNLAQLYCETGNYALAEPLYQQALEIIKKALGVEHPIYATSLNNLAMLYQSIGNYAAAEPLHLKALEINKKANRIENPIYATSLNNLALLYYSMGNYVAAEPLYHQALEIRKKVLGVAHPDYASSLNNLALLYYNIGNDAAAEPLYLEALEINKKVYGAEHPEYANSLNNLALLYSDMGNYGAAEPLYRQALVIFKKAFGVEHPEYANSLDNLAILCQNNGQPEQTEKLMLEANPIWINQLKKGYQFLSGEEAQLFYSSVSNTFEVNNSFIASREKINPSLSALSLNNELAIKGASLHASIRMRQTIQDSEDSVLIGTFNRWMAVKGRINDMNNLPIKKPNEKADSLETVANNLERELIQKSQAFKGLQASLSILWKDVQKRLAENEAAIEFINFRYFTGNTLTNRPLYVALIVRPGYEYPKFVSLFEEKDLYRLLYYADAPKDLQIPRTITPEIMQEVYQLAWKPMEEFLKGVTSVYLSPSGLLTTVPFQALMKNNATCLIDSLDIHYLLSTRELATTEKPDALSGPLTAALFGGILYDLDTAFLSREAMLAGGKVTRSFVPDDSTRGTAFRQLPGTAQEVKQINDRLISNNWKTNVFTGSLATEGQFKRLSGNHAPTILHIATHGFYFPPRNTKEKDLMQFSMENKFRVADNPLTRTGLIMAGGNLAWKGMPIPDGVEDGILTAYEISNMDLRKTSLVVLSACQTGLGDIKPGEGVFGLQRAFRLAGVKTIIMSLWNVADKTTAELMSLYFQYWMKGEKRVDAFNKAVSELRNKYPDEPVKWAVFVMVE